jgi:hypothetical protein
MKKDKRRNQMVNPTEILLGVIATLVAGIIILYKVVLKGQASRFLTSQGIKNLIKEEKNATGAKTLAQSIIDFNNAIDKSIKK